MTLNEYFATGNHLLTEQMITDNDLTDIFDTNYTGGLAALEHAARLKYGYSTLLPTSTADVQRAALGAILINRPKYDQWAAAIIHAVEYDPFVDYKMTETGSDTITKTGTVTDAETKTNTGTQARQNGGSVQRTDALTETTQHGATNTHAKNSYNNGTLRDETRDTTGGSDTVSNTGTQTTTDTTTSTHTETTGVRIIRNCPQAGRGCEQICTGQQAARVFCRRTHKVSKARYKKIRPAAQAAAADV